MRSPARRGILVRSAMLVCVALLAACSRGKQEDERIVLGFSQIGAESEWRKANTESIKSAAGVSGIELHFSDAQQKQENQIAALRGFIAEKVDVIAFAPVVETGWDAVLQEAKSAGIPVILTDREVSADPSLYAGFIGSDFVEEGRKAARWVIGQFPAEGPPVNIVELRGTEGAAPAVDRKQGFEEVLATSPRFRIIRSEPGDFSREGGKAAADAILKSETRPIQVLYAHNDDMALGAIKALDEAGRRPGKDILIVSIDAVRGAFEAMIAGKLNATIECNPLLGPQLMTSVTQVVGGKPIAKRTMVEERLFTMETARLNIQSRKY